MSARNTSEEQQYSAEWRQGVNDELAESARLHREASINFERLRGQLDTHDRRLDKLENAPATRRTDIGTYGGCLAQLATAFFTVVGIVISVTALIITLTH